VSDVVAEILRQRCGCGTARAHGELSHLPTAPAVWHPRAGLFVPYRWEICTAVPFRANSEAQVRKYEMPQSLGQSGALTGQ
jgi:hypothetical protein